MYNKFLLLKHRKVGRVNKVISLKQMLFACSYMYIVYEDFKLDFDFIFH